MAIGSPEISEFCIVGPIWHYLNAGNLQPRKALYPFCTKSRIIFLGPPSLNFSFDTNMSLVQTRYHCNRKPEISEICIVGLLWRYLNADSLQPHEALYPFWRKSRIIFLGSTSLKLPFDTNLALVQTRYHGDRMPRNFGNFHCRPFMAILECG